MSTLRDELVSKVLNSWEAPTNKLSLSEQVFNYIRDNPSTTSVQVSEGTGIDIGRASALMLALYTQGKLGRKQYPNPNRDGKHTNVFMYWTEVDSFTTKGTSRKEKKVKKPKKLHVKALDVLKYKALEKVANGEIPLLRRELNPFDPEEYVKGLSLTEVKQLHKFLEGYFSG